MTNEDLEITGISADDNFSLNKGDDESDISEKQSSQESDSSGVNNEDVPGHEETPCSSKVKVKLVVAPRKKRKLVRSRNQALSHTTKGMEDLASSQKTCAKLMIEGDWKRDELFLKHREKEAKRNREPELRLGQIYATPPENSTLNRTNNNCRTISHKQTKNFDRISCQHLHYVRPPNPTLPLQEMQRNFIIMV